MAEYKVNVYLGIDKQPTHGGSLENCKEFISKRIIQYNIKYKNPKMVFYIYKKGNNNSWNHHCCVCCIYVLVKGYCIFNNRFCYRTLIIKTQKYKWEMKDENIEYMKFTLFTPPEKFYNYRTWNSTI